MRRSRARPALRTSTSRLRASASKSKPFEPLQGLRWRDQSLLDEVDRKPQRGLRRSLRRARLQDPQFAVFDRELDVLHVGEFLFEPRQRFAQLRRDRRKRTGDRLFGFGSAASGHDVFALRLKQDVDDRLRRAGRRIARKRHARAGRQSAIAEHHRLDRDGGAVQILEMLKLAIGAGAIARP